MEKKKAILPVFLAVFLCLSVSAVYAQNDYEDKCAEIFGVTLNGEYDYLEIAPGGLIKVVVFYDYLNPGLIPDIYTDTVVGFEDTPRMALVDGLTSDRMTFTIYYDYNKSFEMEAPIEPGTYHIMEAHAKGNSASAALKMYNENPSARRIIATIEVIGDEEENEKWTLLHQSNGKLTGDCLYTIAFLQRQNDLRVQIETPGVQEVETGKVFISVDEDVFVEYDNTGCVYESIVGVEDSDFVELKPGASGPCETQKAFFDLIMGFVPYSGMFASSINLGTAIYKDTSKEFEVNEDLDLYKILDALPYEYFTTNKFQNVRDVVTIPWALDIFNGREAIRVDCPKMVFPSKGTHTVVFCVIVNVHNVKVRHTIALPIKIGKQRMEA